MGIVLQEKETATAESYRAPMQIKQLRKYQSTSYYVCPRCNVTMDREFMRYCDRCGQRLDWKGYRKAKVVKS